MAFIILLNICLVNVATISLFIVNLSHVTFQLKTILTNDLLLLTTSDLLPKTLLVKIFITPPRKVYTYTKKEKNQTSL